jgi:UDP-glucose:glycoprotein glucosyltransferase
VAPAELMSVELPPSRSISTEEEQGAEDQSAVEVSIVVDPLSTAGQRAAALVRLCHDHLHLAVHLVLIPPFEVTEFPLKNFYRFVAHPINHPAAALESETAPATSLQAMASFRQLPRAHILTARIDVPEIWNVQALSSPQDLDNLVCDAKSCGDTAKSDLSSVSYGLKNLLVAGQCYERVGSGAEMRMTPPNGLQLTLDSVDGILSSKMAPSLHSDTLVMQNLGYFQLQADAGLFALRLAEGKANTLFRMVNSVELKSFCAADDATCSVDRGMLVAVKSFSDEVQQVRVQKVSGLEHVPLLDDDSPDAGTNTASADGSGGGMWSSISAMFGGSSSTNAVAKVNPSEEDRIHVFSLATGHAYERLMRIMMLSVSKRTKSPLKFWLFENYLSPTFKKLAAAMSEEYGFEVGYVTYKWPKWLTQQTVKQRIIWGYKILFLDVLFPLSVKKVIYVDADQVVRADLKELWEIDLHGKPYGYVPFCSSRKETLGFQFWRQGYWENHLQGKPYHISALYVVDLARFR